MRAVVQRVAWAKVSVDGEVVGSCGHGLLALIAAGKEDSPEAPAKMASKIATLRIFNDPDDKMNLSVQDVGGSVLAISNFTVYGDAAKQRRPSFMAAAGYEDGRALFDATLEELKKLGLPTQTGVFGADMKVELLNDGPVTLILEV